MSTRRLVAAFAVTATAFSGMLGLAVPPAQATSTFVVTRTDDPGPGPCVVGDCTLREAVIAANADPDSSEIVLQAGSTYALSMVGDVGAGQGDLDILHSVTFSITGGTANATIDGNGGVTADRVLEIVAGETILDHVDVANGVAPPNGSTAPILHFGGGVLVNPAAAFLMYDGRLFGNTAEANPNGGDAGGAVYNDGGRVFLLRTLVSSNSASFGFGGAIETIGDQAQTTVLNSKFSRNDAAFGGVLDSSGGLTSIQGSQLGSNTAGNGGAIYGGFNGNGSVSLVNVTANDNVADNLGGVARLIGGDLYVKNSTLSGNTSQDGGGISVSNPFLATPPPSVTLEDSIVAGNLDTDSSNGTHPDCDNPDGGLIHTNGFNLVGISDGCGIFKATGDQFGSALVPLDPGLVGTGPNANGGPVLTWALTANSLARNAGDPSENCEPADARGLTRSLGGRCDIGAYELASCSGTVIGVVGTNQDDPGTFDPFATSGADGFAGLLGDDSFKGLGGDDGICGNGGDDRLSGGDGGDHVVGGSGDDVVKGNADDDTVSGGSGDDVAKGGPGNDVLKGGGGNDRLVGGPGKHDVCTGGPGADTAVGCEVEHSI